MKSLTLDSQPFKPFIPSPQSHPRMLTGQRFGRLLVYSLHGRAGGGGLMWLCRCSCGQWPIILASSLLRSEQPTLSCGCWAREKQRQAVTTHGDSQRCPEYLAYASAKSRCTNPNVKNYRDYGGRGIQFRFSSYQEFIQHIGYRPTPRHTLDRIENHGHYEIGNVRWVTWSQQQRNKRNSRLITWQGETKPLAAWSEALGITQVALHQRFSRGWSVEKTLTTPIRVSSRTPDRDEWIQNEIDRERVEDDRMYFEALYD
jgi:hypothetical protein